ncbi:MAG: O-antigen ligase family protein, partial [Nitrososphaera sp.]|nr:O-antigen ligase family protein [Nitrososphaera sp.]
EDPIILAGGVYALLWRRAKVLAFFLRERTTWFVWPYFGFVLWVFLVSFVGALFEPESVYALSGMFRSLSLLRGICFMSILVICVDSRRDISRIVAALLGIGLTQLCILYCQKFNFLQVNEWLTPRFSLIYETSIYSIAGLRSDGTFGNPNHASVGMVPIGALAYGYFLLSKGKLWRRMFSLLLAIGIFIAMIALTQSRTGTAGLVSAAVILHALTQLLRTRVAIFATLIMCLVSGVLLPYILREDSLAMERLSVFRSTQNLFEDDSLSTRQMIWRDALAELDSSSIVLGRGLGAFIAKGFFDSGYIDYIYSGGLISVVLFVTLCVSVAIQSFRYCDKYRHLPHSAYLFGTTCAVFVSMLVTAVSHAVLYFDKVWLLHVTIATLAMLSSESGMHRPIGSTKPEQPEPVNTKGATAFSTVA